MEEDQTKNRKLKSSNDLAVERTGMAEGRTKLASKRTKFAAERTLMAWMRTSFSLISFGFTIHKFFQYLSQIDKVSAGIVASGPKNLGLVLVVLGVALLIVATIEHVLFMKELNRETGSHFKISSAIVFSILFLLIGLLAFLNLLFKIGPF